MKFSWCLLALACCLSPLRGQDEAEIATATTVAKAYAEATWTGDGISAAKLLRPADLESFRDQMIALSEEGDEAEQELAMLLFQGLAEAIEDAESEEAVELILTQVGMTGAQFKRLAGAEIDSVKTLLSTFSGEQIFALYCSDWNRWTPERMQAKAVTSELISASPEKTADGALLHLLLRTQPEAEADVAPYVDVYTMEKVGKDWRVHSSGWDRNYIEDLRSSLADEQEE